MRQDLPNRSKFQALAWTCRRLQATGLRAIIASPVPSALIRARCLRFLDEGVQTQSTEIKVPHPECEVAELLALP